MTPITTSENGMNPMTKPSLFRIALACLIAFVFLSSPVSAAPGDKAPGGPAKNTQTDQVHLDFNDVDIRVFIKFISEVTGKNFIIDRKVTGKISIISPEKVSADEAYRVFESVLEVHGFAAVNAGKLVKIIPSREAQQKNIATKLKLDAISDDDHVITQLIHLKYADPGDVKKLLAPMISKSSSIVSYDPTNMLMITDLSSNIQRLMKIIRTIDVTGIGQEITVIPLEYAESKKFTSLLSTVFKSSGGKKSKSQKTIQFVADDRTNSIVTLASKGDTERIMGLVNMLDREVPRGKESIHVYYLENSSAEELAKVLQSLSKKKTQADKGKKGVIKSENVQITADKATNSLIIIAERDDYAVLEEVIKKLDIPRTMVYIECLIMEVNVDKNFNLGMEWTVGKDTTINGRDAGVGVGFDGGSSYANTANLAGLNAAGVSTLPAGFALGVFSEALTIGDVTFPSLGAVIQAYKKDEETEILSTPQILTTDNEEASISVGKKIPYLTKDVTGETNYNNYEYKDVGISLKITPNINEDRKIRLKIAQETSRVLGDSQSLSPSTLKRTIDTTVIIDDGSTVVLGGLIDDSFTDTEYKVPCLGDIPLVKYLFSSVGNSTSKTNLYIFLTSHVVENRSEAERLSKKKHDQISSIKGGKIKMYPGGNKMTGENEEDMVIEGLNVETTIEE